MMNSRAAEILGMPARDALQDLRVLPSPLGDMLFEALTRGRSVTRVEVQLALRNLPLEISTYPGDGRRPRADRRRARVRGPDRPAPARAGGRSAEQLQLLTRVVARIADEIKNPLVSINAFMELIGERYDDATFRNQFASVVGRDVRRLVQIFDKLAALVNEGDYKRETIDLRPTVEECLAELGAQALPGPRRGAPPQLHRRVHPEARHRHPLARGILLSGRGNRRCQEGRLLPRLVPAAKDAGPEAKISVSISRLDREDRVRITVASRTTEVRAEELQGSSIRSRSSRRTSSTWDRA